ncbi:WD40 repeat-like protein [Teratosphaeria nubilosa]|uniref:WD40 repeat-like protein n=1 Tax=Teratosphaeria nubilosa TaxID=161662 RepID=A0A6G1LE18_9PEZI|nr:WD40 repeat-like protein [Teratosphaeria nubilosa]
MDVHRSRFVPYPTSAISALAFSRTSDAGFSEALPTLRLALGRENGTIEIWNPLRGSWVQETVFVGDGKGIDGLVWTQDPDEQDLEGKVIPGHYRLFSIGSAPAVTEWDLETGQIKRRSTGNFDEVWCLAAQPRWKPSKKDEEPKSQDLVAGCIDGSLVLLSAADDDLQFKRTLARVGGKRPTCLCVTYQNRDVALAGFGDSTIRVYDTRNATMIRQMSLGGGVPGHPKNAMVWKIKALPNGDIVTGDSNGNVCFWHGTNYSQLRRLTGHDTDCLDLVTSADGKTIFSGSITGKIAVYKSADGRSSWAKTSHRRLHDGEVKAMASYDSKKGLSIVVSGGSDMTPLVTPLREFGNENVRSLPYLPHETPVASASRARLLVSWWSKYVYVWRIARQKPTNTDEDTHPRKLVAKISLSTGKEFIRSATITADGKLLAVSTSAALRVFQLKRRPGTDALAVRKVEMPKDFADDGARLVSFSPNGKWLVIVRADNEVHLARFAADFEQPKKINSLSETVELDRHRRPMPHSAFAKYERSVVKVAWASDSSILVAGDLAGFLDAWVLEGHEDTTAPSVDKAKHDSDKGSDIGSEAASSDDDDDDDQITLYYGQHWTEAPNVHMIPKLESAPLVMAFRPTKPKDTTVNGNPGVHVTRHNPHAHSRSLPTGEHRLWVLTARHQMHEFDVLAGKITEWSKRNPTSALPEELIRIKDRAISAVWDAKDRLWLYGSSWLAMLDVKQDLSGENLELSKKRRRRRDAHDLETPKKAKSGAGDRIPRDGPDNLRQYRDGKWLTPEKTRRQQEEEEDEDEELDLQLVQTQSRDHAVTSEDNVSGKGRAWWLTFKYRPILGIVPLADEDQMQDPDRPFEVAIVERPLKAKKQ